MEFRSFSLVYEFLGSTVFVASLVLRVVLGVSYLAAKALWLGQRLRVLVLSLNVAECSIHTVCDNHLAARRCLGADGHQILKAFIVGYEIR